MRFAARNEIAYLSSVEGSPNDAGLVREMTRQLDALRRYDQCFCEADWRPRRSSHSQRASATSRVKRT
jgi:hypothetical protein